MSNEILKFEIAQPIHRQQILHLAEHVFVKGEPVRIAMNVTWESAKAGWEKMVDECLSHPHSHVALNGSDEVIGFRLSRILDLDKYAPTDSINEFLLPGVVKHIEDRMSENWAHVLVDSNGNTCKRVLQFLALAVRPDYGGRGVAVKMSEENMKLGKELGCKYCIVGASNWMSQRVFEKLGFVTMGSFAFEDLKDENGKRLIEMTDPKQIGSKWQVKKL